MQEWTVGSKLAAHAAEDSLLTMQAQCKSDIPVKVYLYIYKLAWPGVESKTYMYISTISDKPDSFPLNTY